MERPKEISEECNLSSLARDSENYDSATAFSVVEVNQNRHCEDQFWKFKWVFEVVKIKALKRSDVKQWKLLRF